uniref:NADH-ubiquinone oxidoreductase chain 2 n=1 Tax=Amblyomma geoemydae TaxID=1325863 RepID=A0A5P8FTD2_9ACAR|nr:NADH dehydrogenase subunit 2 [Amblyomma geoemydae]
MFFNNFMKWMIILTIIITFSSDNWFIYWLMMEMNLMLFIPLMNSKKKNSSNWMVAYFVEQSFSSTLFFMMSISFNMFNLLFFEFMIMISILIKLAMIPFHFWLTSLSELINYNTLFLILTLQKFIPLFILVMNFTEKMIFFAMISSIFGSLLLFNLKSFKKILIFSSISHQGWMISLIAMNSNFWFTYMMIYSLLIFKILSILKKNNIELKNNFFKKKIPMSEKISMTTLILSLGGMPPFIGFIMKFLSILIIINNSIFVVMILILSSIINIFIYLRMMNTNLFINSIYFSKKLFFNYNQKSVLFNMYWFISIFILNMMMF